MSDCADFARQRRAAPLSDRHKDGFIGHKARQRSRMPHKQMRRQKAQMMPSHYYYGIH